MKIEEAKMQFVQTWGVLGSNWGIPKSMAQIHALLLANKQGLCAEDVMEQVQLSRGNVNINMRELINWNLVSRQSRLGERKEYFVAEHDIWSIARNIVQERRKRELQPVYSLLENLKTTPLEGGEEEVKHFKEMIAALDEFVGQMNQMADLMGKINDNAFFKKMIKMLSA